MRRQFFPTIRWSTSIPCRLPAFGRDEVFDGLKYFGKGSGPNQEPRRAIVFLGFEAPEENEEENFFEKMAEITGALNRVVFVYSQGDISLRI